jgi:hypothetical protein
MDNQDWHLVSLEEYDYDFETDEYTIKVGK